MANPPIFLFGSPRSGTTLCRSILNAHPDISCPRETAFFHLAQQLVNMNQNALNFWEYYRVNRRFTYQNIDASIVEAKMKDLEFTYKNLFVTLMAELAKRDNKTSWCEKTPGHEQYFDLIYQSFPDLKAIFMVIDPRSVCLSLMNTPWGSKDIFIQVKIWRESVKKYFLIMNNPQVFLVKYEDLVRNPESTTADVCNHIPIDFNIEMVNNRNMSSYNNQDSNTWTDVYEKQVERPISKESIFKWKDKFSEEEIRKIELLSFSYFERLGYVRYTKETFVSRIYLMTKYYCVYFIYTFKAKLLKMRRFKIE